MQFTSRVGAAVATAGRARPAVVCRKVRRDSSAMKWAPGRVRHMVAHVGADATRNMTKGEWRPVRGPKLSATASGP